MGRGGRLARLCDREDSQTENNEGDGKMVGAYIAEVHSLMFSAYLYKLVYNIRLIRTLDAAAPLVLASALFTDCGQADLILL
jgi:hypothetical protein